MGIHIVEDKDGRICHRTLTSKEFDEEIHRLHQSDFEALIVSDVAKRAAWGAVSVICFFIGGVHCIDGVQCLIHEEGNLEILAQTITSGLIAFGLAARSHLRIQRKCKEFFVEQIIDS